MTPNHRRPTPAELAAYADGELGAEARRAVESWLADHPDAAAEVETQQHFATLWRASAAPEPGQVAWAGVLARVENGLAAGAGPPKPEKRRATRLLWLLAGLTTAAAVALTVWSLGWPDQSLEEPSAEQNGEEPFAVLADDDVEIMSIHADDTSALVVGEPPVPEPVILAAAEDISLHNIEPDADGMVPGMVQGEPSGPSMIVAPLGTKD